MSDSILPMGLPNTRGNDSNVNKFDQTKAEQINEAQELKKQLTTTKAETSSIDAQVSEKLAVKEIQEADEQKAIEEVASKLQDFVNLIDKKLQFSVDGESGRRVVTVSDKLSGDVIRQIPSEEVLALTNKLSDLADVINHSGKIITAEV